MAENIQFTQATFDRLKVEHEHLTTVWRIDIAKRIEAAHELGDLKENGDYHAAKEEQGKTEARIRDLAAMIERAEIVEGGADDGTVAAGSVVGIRYEGDDDVETYLLGSIEEKRDGIDGHVARLAHRQGAARRRRRATRSRPRPRRHPPGRDRLGRRHEPNRPCRRAGRSSCPGGAPPSTATPSRATRPHPLLLHGWTATADLNWFPSYGPLAEHVRVVALDHRGHGRGIRTDRRFRLADCADDAVAVADAFGVDHFIPVGYSMGGLVAQLVGHRTPTGWTAWWRGPPAATSGATGPPPVGSPPSGPWPLRPGSSPRPPGGGPPAG